MPKFKVINRNNQKEEILSVDKEEIVIGRLKTSDIALDSKSVSRKHALITKIDFDYFLSDENSGNGTLLNGKKLTPQEKQVLHKGDIIRIEEFEIHPAITKLGEDSVEEKTDSGVIEVKMIKKVLKALDTEQFPSLEILTPPDEGKKVYLNDDIEEMTIGRDADCYLPINTNVISRKHAVLNKKWGGVTIADLKSKNGTFVNNHQISEKLLRNGDVILLGNIKILYRNPQEIDVEALSQEYEEEQKNKLKKQREQAQKKQEEQKKVSEQAKMSVEADKPEEVEEKQEETPEENKKEEAPLEDLGLDLDNQEPEKETPPDENKPTPNKPAPRFNTIELILMAAGGLALVVVFYLISVLLK